MLLACLLHHQCPWNCGNCDSLNTNPKVSLHDILKMRLRSHSTVGGPDEKGVKGQYWCSAMLPLIWAILVQCCAILDMPLQHQCRWSCGLCGPLNSNTKPNLIGSKAVVTKTLNGPDGKGVEGAMLVQCHAPIGMPFEVLVSQELRAFWIAEHKP